MAAWRELRAARLRLITRGMTFEACFEALCLDRQAACSLVNERGRLRACDYAEFRARVLQTAARVSDAALGARGGWVGLCLQNGADWPVLFWALLAAGRKPLLLDPALSDARLRDALTQAGAFALLTGARRPALAGVRQMTPREVTSGAYGEGFAPAWADRAALCASGGRICVYDGRAACLQAVALLEARRSGEAPGRALCTVPPYRAAGLMAGVIAAPLAGYAMVYAPPRGALTACRQGRVSLLLAAPAFLPYMDGAVRRRLTRRTKPSRAVFAALARWALLTQALWPQLGLRLSRRLFSRLRGAVFGASLRQAAVLGGPCPRAPLYTLAALGVSAAFACATDETAILAYEAAPELDFRLSGCLGRLLPLAHARVAEGDELIVGSEAMHIGCLREGRLAPPALDDHGMFHTGECVRLDEKQRLWKKERGLEMTNDPKNSTVSEIEAQVLAFFSEALHAKAPLSPTAHFINDLGGDSLQMLSIMLRIEETYGILLEEADSANCTCARDVARIIYEHLHGGSAPVEEAPKASVKPITRIEEMPEYAALLERKRQIRGENPYFICHDSVVRDTSLMGGHEVLNFGSYNYAGMSGRRETVEAAVEAARKYGTSPSGSRLLGGEKTLHQQLEAAIAHWKHTEDCIVLVSGHATNVTFVGNFCGKGDLIVYDALAHNSIHEGCRLSDAVSKAFPHNDVEALEGILRTQRDKFAKVLIVCEGAYSMDGDIAPVPDYVRLKKQYGCFLMVDEAHSAGVLGKTGAGVDEYFGLAPDDIDIKMGTLSKGLGTCGGYLAGSHALVEYLRYSLPGFVFSVGLSPALAAASLEAVRLLQEEPEIMEHMRRNIRVFVEEAHKRGLDTCLAGESAIIPILVGNDADCCELSVALGHKGVFVPPAVFPAVPHNSARLRFCVISEHKPEQIVRALDILVETADEMGIDIRKRQ